LFLPLDNEEGPTYTQTCRQKNKSTDTEQKKSRREIKGGAYFKVKEVTRRKGVKDKVKKKKKGGGLPGYNRTASRYCNKAYGLLVFTLTPSRNLTSTCVCSAWSLVCERER
jgi:hypothetical protein